MTTPDLSKPLWEALNETCIAAGIQMCVCYDGDGGNASTLLVILVILIILAILNILNVLLNIYLLRDTGRVHTSISTSSIERETQDGFALVVFEASCCYKCS